MQAVIGPKDDDDESDTSGGAYSETGETSGTDDDNSITKTRGGEPDGNDLIVTLSATQKSSCRYDSFSFLGDRIYRRKTSEYY